MVLVGRLLMKDILNYLIFEMSYFINILFLILLLFPSSQKDPMYNKQGKPSTWGINTYITKNQESLIAEYTYRIDTIYDVNIFTENLTKESEGDLGEFHLPNYVVITNEEKYIAYEFKDLTKFRQKTSSYTDRTVKAVVFHELTHMYVRQIALLLRNDTLESPVNTAYNNFVIYPSNESSFGATFIEEGVCEYVLYYLDESAPLRDIPVPDNEDELTDPKNKVSNLYYYSVIFLEGFLDKEGLEKGIQILLTNKPPTYQEILKPELFFNRLNKN